jgi:DNA polymerase-1
MKGLKWKEMETGVVFGFMQHIIKLAKKFDTNKFVFAWDSRRSFRRNIYARYKRQRHFRQKTAEEQQLDQLTFPQFSLLRRNIIPKLGFKNNYIQTGLEADDIIASITHNNHPKRFTIVSTDTDLYQLLSKSCSFYSPLKKKLYTAEDFKDEFKLPPNAWGDVLAITGCKTDEVKGVEGIGRVYACRYLRGELKANSKIFKKITSELNRKIVENNVKLVKLPFSATLPIKLSPFNSLEQSDFLDVFHQYGFQSFLRHEEFSRWKKLMRM